jgi:ABC-type transport system involved in cytochrome c biogenesis permease subunit
MPLDSFARNELLTISGRSTFSRQPAAAWLARVLFTPDLTRQDAIFLVNNPEVVEALGISAESRGRYSYAQLEPARARLEELARAAFHLSEEERSLVDRELIRLFDNVSTYERLAESSELALPDANLAVTNAPNRAALGLPPGIGPISMLDLLPRAERLRQLVEDAQEMRPEQRTDVELELIRVGFAFTAQARARRLPPAVIPPVGPEGGPWMGVAEAAMASATHAAVGRELAAWTAMARAFRAGEPAAFDAAAGDFAASTKGRATERKAIGHLGLELRLNSWSPFYRAEMLYGFGFLFTMASLLFRGPALRRIALVLVAAGLVPHTFGIVVRMIIMGRPPVTNLYATFVFVAWMCVLVALAVEYLQRNRLGLLIAGVCGLAMLVTAGRFAADGDTMGVVVAVLDSNFWLATHVICISIGYAGCVVSGLVGHLYLAVRAARRAPGDEGLAEIARAVYGTQAFGLIFSFLGTMLGGIWADQSWGRFWGWDPKENGALVIVLWSAILFHARAAKVIGDRGFSAGSVIGVVWVLLAWMGVNLLSVGLHSYGFTSGVAQGLAIVCAAELIFVTVLVPLGRRGPAPTAAASAGSASAP